MSMTGQTSHSSGTLYNMKHPGMDHFGAINVAFHGGIFFYEEVNGLCG